MISRTIVIRHPNRTERYTVLISSDKLTKPTYPPKDRNGKAKNSFRVEYFLIIENLRNKKRFSYPLSRHARPQFLDGTNIRLATDGSRTLIVTVPYDDGKTNEKFLILEADLQSGDLIKAKILGFSKKPPLKLGKEDLRELKRDLSQSA